MFPFAGNRNEHGFALISVLWTVLLLTVLLSGLMAVARTQSHLALNQRDRVQAEALAQAVTNRVLVGLLDRREGAQWLQLGAAQEVNFDHVTAIVTITDEAGKLDLNTGALGQFEAMFQAVGASERKAIEWTDAIAAQREKKRFGGFHDNDELAMLEGFSEPLAECLAPYLTVHAGRREVDLSLASAELAAALTEVAISRSPQRNTVVSRSVSPVGRVLSITVEVPVRSGQMYALHSTVRLTGDRRIPFWLLARAQGVSFPVTALNQCRQYINVLPV